jgi:hypothetical protein
MREQARAQLFGDLIDLEFKEIEDFYHAEEAEADAAARLNLRSRMTLTLRTARK